MLKDGHPRFIIKLCTVVTMTFCHSGCDVSLIHRGKAGRSLATQSLRKKLQHNDLTSTGELDQIDVKSLQFGNGLSGR
eukprot:s2790_g2.t1